MGPVDLQLHNTTSPTRVPKPRAVTCTKAPGALGLIKLQITTTPATPHWRWCPPDVRPGGHATRRRLELRPWSPAKQETTGCLLEAGDEGFDCGGITIMTFKIEIHAATETFFAANRVDHADKLGALLVNRCSIEIVDLDVA